MMAEGPTTSVSSASSDEHANEVSIITILIVYSNEVELVDIDEELYRRRSWRLRSVCMVCPHAYTRLLHCFETWLFTWMCKYARHPSRRYRVMCPWTWPNVVIVHIGTGQFVKRTSSIFFNQWDLKCEYLITLICSLQDTIFMSCYLGIAELCALELCQSLKNCIIIGT